MDITSPTLDNGTRATPEFRRNETQAKFEIVNNIDVPKPRRPGFFSGLLSFIGKLGPIGAFFGPPGWLGMAAAGGLGAIGDKARATHYQKEQQRLSTASQQVMTTPGLMSPGTFASDPTLETIAYSKDIAMGQAIKGM